MMKQNWIYKKIGEICEIKTGKLDANAAVENGIYPFFTCSKEPLSIDTYAYDCECILIAGNGDLNVKYYNGKFNAYQRTYILSLKTNVEDVSVMYLYAFFLLYVEELRKKSIGGIIKYIKLEHLRDALIPLPPLHLQQSIVAELDNINNLINIKKSQLKDLDNLAQSIFYEMFGDLNVQKNTLIELCNSKNDIKCGPFGTQLSKTEYTKKGVAVWGIPQINSHFKIQPSDYVTEEKADYLKDYDVIAGDIVMSRKGNVGQCCVYPKSFPLGIIHSDVLRIRLDSNKTNSLFMMYQLHLSENVKHQIQLVSSGAIMPGINVTKLKKIEVDVPPLPLQQKFAEKIEAIEKHKQIVNVTIKDLETLLASRMQFWFE